MYNIRTSLHPTAGKKWLTKIMKYMLHATCTVSDRNQHQEKVEHFIYETSHS